jgi:hypothetical protein
MIGDLEESLINGEGNPINFSDPAAIEEFVTSSDPIATEGTYMMIVALLSCSVPVLTAHLCMGASHLTGLLDLSVKEASTRHYGDARNKAIREEATKLNQEIKAMRLAFVNHATNEAAQNPGQSVGVYKDSQGRMQREMVDRRKAGDWAVAGHLGGEAQKANYKFMFTKQFMESHALLGSLTGRRMTFNMSRMDKAQVSISNQIQDMFHSHALGLGGGLGSPFAARQKGTSTVADGVKNANMGTDGN